MFWKKKAVVEKGTIYQCPVPGCGLSCTDEDTLRRHMDWAHPAATTTKTETVTLNPQRQ